jgi:hypothetical protein
MEIHCTHSYLGQDAEERLHLVARDGVADKRKAFASHAVQETRGIGPEGLAIQSVRLPLPVEELCVWPAVP